MTTRARDDRDNILLPLLENGLDYLAEAVRRLDEEPSARDMKYVLRDLASGVDLVLKERLRRHDRTLVVSNPRKFNATAYESGDFKSVMHDELVERLQASASVGIPERDQQDMDLLRRKRNKAEHFAFNDSSAAVRAVAFRVLGFALDFFGQHLPGSTLSPAAAKQLNDLRETLSRLEAFVAHRWDAIRATVDAAVGAVVTCPACTHEACILDDGARCAFCGYADGAEAAANEYAHLVLGVSHYRTVKDGDRWVVSKCPECEREALVDHGPMGDTAPGIEWVCFSCATEWPDGALERCGKCDEWTPGGEGSISVCGDCFAWAVAAND